MRIIEINIDKSTLRTQAINNSGLHFFKTILIMLQLQNLDQILVTKPTKTSSSQACSKFGTARVTSAKSQQQEYHKANQWLDQAPIRIGLDKKMGNFKISRQKNKELAQMRRRILQKDEKKNIVVRGRGKVEMPIWWLEALGRQAVRAPGLVNRGRGGPPTTICLNCRLKPSVTCRLGFFATPLAGSDRSIVL